VGASSGLAEATDTFNRAQIKSVADIVRSHHSSSQSIGILGLTYKPNTDIVEESFGLLLAQELSSSNLSVIVYDPSQEATRALGSYKNIRAAQSAVECIAESGVVVLATPWEEFRKVPREHWVHNCQPSAVPRVVIDCWCELDHLIRAHGVRYVRLGFGGAAEQHVETTSTAL
jgi:UDPglucose 6-dehydrogenase